MDIEIFGQDELITHIQQGRKVFSHCISISNPPEPPGDYHGTPDIIRDAFFNTLELEFWDYNWDGVTENKYRFVEKSDIYRIVEFISKTKSYANGYTIHCRAGVSRSTAVALCVLHQLSGNEKFAAQTVLSKRPIAQPLRRVVKLYDEIYHSYLLSYAEKIHELRNKQIQREIRSITK